ncbi:MAG: hypothetical protein UIH27_11115 [Ruminococcus sp.]|nr:hypothetical protein [Ruminococcus sp.]
MLDTISKTKKDAAEIIEVLKQLPKEKQEYVSGYIQGMVDSMTEQKESA